MANDCLRGLRKPAVAGESRETTQFHVPRRSPAATPWSGHEMRSSEPRHTCYSHFDNAGASLRTTQINYEHNNSFHRWMRMWRDSFSIRCHTDCDASLSLSRLPASRWGPVFVFRHRTCERFRALAGLAPLSCVAQRTGRNDPPRLLP